MKTNALYWMRDENDIVTLKFNCPDSSANIFTPDVMQELDGVLSAIDASHKSNPIRALFLKSTKDAVFIAGADIQEIQRLTDPKEASDLSRMGQEIFSKLENLPFPTAALIHGVALGGGLEITLACDMRFASDDPSTRLGLPETQLGVIPAWGGCTRLPRIVGTYRALEMILSGKELSAKEALRAGLVSAVVPRDQLRDYAISQIASGVKRTSSIKRLASGHIICAKAAQNSRKETGGHYPALQAAISVVRKGLVRSEAGFKQEQKKFGELAVSSVSKELIQLFYNREAARKNPGAKAEARKVYQAGVVGAGVMGRGIAYLLANASLPTRVSDAQEPVLESMLVATRGMFAFQVGRRRLRSHQAEERHSLISPTTTFDGLEHADFIIEAVSENLELKQKIFRELSERVSEDCILASNTSTIPIAKIAEAAEHSERVIGMHFFNPPEKMSLIEIVVGEQTSPETVATTFALTKRFGKTPIYVKDCPGFLVNRLLIPYEIAALELFLAGIPMEVLDKVMEDWGMRMGPIATLDHVGLDIARDVAFTLSEAYPDRMAAPDTFSKLVDAGYLGDKNGKGFWMDRGKKRVPNPQVYELIGATRDHMRRYNDSEILEHLLRPMAEEARRCLDEGIVQSRGDIDLSLVLGIGFPPFRGSVLNLFL